MILDIGLLFVGGDPLDYAGGHVVREGWEVYVRAAALRRARRAH